MEYLNIPETKRPPIMNIRLMPIKYMKLPKIVDKDNYKLRVRIFYNF